MSYPKDFEGAKQAASEHFDHVLEIVQYGLHDESAPAPRIYNVAIECNQCGLVIMDWDNPEIGGARP
jgi:hypothetical protein